MMRALKTLGLSAFALGLLAAPAVAGSDAEDRAAAISACRASLAGEAGVLATQDNISFDRSRTKPRVIEVRFRVSGRDGAVWYAQCDVRRGSGEITSIVHGPGANIAVAQAPALRSTQLPAR
ncbi:MAG: hypothetical protein GC189_12025 [Alphaproteobacteria bacterium]|nr:hypothetical protein [Alphaproteobacteria bacterium]